MKTRHFIKQLDRKAIEAAIQEAERKTSGEICVLIHHKPVENAVAAAQAEFTRLGMQKTRHRNAVLLFIAPASQAFALIGDQGVHAKCGDTFWGEVASVMQKYFRDGDYTAALLAGINRAGALLAEHFPPPSNNADELPNQVIEQ
jgi:uncharacterized membrane protein